MTRSQAIQLVHETSSTDEAQPHVASVAPRAQNDRAHKERVRASLDWALDEYADTLAKLAK